MAPSTAPTIGATQNSHSWAIAQSPTYKATAVLRAGLTEVLVTGMLIKWIRVRHNPIAIGAKPFGALSSVAPRMTKRNIIVITTSVISAANKLYPPGEWAPYPFEAKPAANSKPPVTSVQFSPDGKTILAGSQSGLSLRNHRSGVETGQIAQ